MSEIKRKNKSKKKYFVIMIIIITIIILGVLAYITYDRYYRVDEEIPNDSGAIEEDVKVNNEEVLEYLGEVPFYGVNGYKKDAYQGSKLTIKKDIDASVFLSIASTMLDEDQVLSYKKGMPLPDGQTESDMNDNSSDYTYFKKEDITGIVHDLYNFDLSDMKEFNSPGNKYLTEKGQNYNNSTFIYKDGYFLSYGTVSNPLGLKVSKLDSYETNDKYLIINEKYGIYTCSETSCYIYSSSEPVKNRGLNDKNIIYKCNLGDNCKYELTDELKNNKMLKTYKHKFRLIDGQYFWESSQMID